MWKFMLTQNLCVLQSRPTVDGPREWRMSSPIMPARTFIGSHKQAMSMWHSYVAAQPAIPGRVRLFIELLTDYTDRIKRQQDSTQQWEALRQLVVSRLDDVHGCLRLFDRVDYDGMSGVTERFGELAQIAEFEVDGIEALLVVDSEAVFVQVLDATSMRKMDSYQQGITLANLLLQVPAVSMQSLRALGFEPL